MSQLKVNWSASPWRGLQEGAVELGGGVDLEPVVGEGVVPDDDVAVAHHGHEGAAIQARDPGSGMGNNRRSSGGWKS
jgi:hypothetical protein